MANPQSQTQTVNMSSLLKHANIFIDQKATTYMYVCFVVIIYMLVMLWSIFINAKLAEFIEKFKLFLSIYGPIDKNPKGFIIKVSTHEYLSFQFFIVISLTQNKMLIVIKKKTLMLKLKSVAKMLFSECQPSLALQSS